MTVVDYTNGKTVASIPMIATTSMSSMSVKPDRLCMGLLVVAEGRARESRVHYNRGA